MTQLFAIDHIVGNSAWTDRVRKRIVQIANYRYSVLISGPTGSGKELVARGVHAHSDRAGRPFIPVNCAAIPGGLFSSQLFGHVKGAFTGAHHSTLGCFRAADSGVIFLDEIGELDMECQGKLLRVLQERQVVPVGSHEGTPVDVRVIAASNRNLTKEVQAGRFRLDLFYRLNVLSIETVGLNDRVEDIEPLAKHFLARATFENGLPMKSISPAALALLETHHWSGNVRELQNLIERAVVFSETDVIGSEAFPKILDAQFNPNGFPLTERRGLSGEPAGSSVPANHLESVPECDEVTDDWPTLANVEENHIRKTLHETFYNQSAAARMLGVDRKLLSRKIKKYELALPKTQVLNRIRNK